jgi:DNA-binding NtrC family response regulator
MAAKAKALVVDDEPDIREALRELLELDDLEVQTASGGREALDVLGQPGDGLRIIISDYRMPEMDGLDFLGRAQKLRPEVLRVLLTAFADTPLAVKALNEARVARFVAKPVEPEAFEAMVKELLAADDAQRLRDAALKRSLDLMKKRGPDPPPPP